MDQDLRVTLNGIWSRTKIEEEGVSRITLRLFFFLLVKLDERY